MVRETPCAAGNSAASCSREFIDRPPNAANLPPAAAPKAARRSCGCMSCWPTSSRASRDQSVGRRAAASDPAVRRRRCCRRISTISAAIRPTRAPTVSAAPPPPGSTGATSCRRPMDHETEVIVLNGTREGLFLGAIAAKRYVDAARRAARHPDPQSVLRRLFGRRRRRRMRAGVSADHPRDRLPARPRRASTRRCCSAPSPSTSPRRRTRRARSPTRPISRGWSAWRAATAS